MSNMNAILLLGTDLGDKKKNLVLAQNYIGKELGEIVKIGKIVETEPVGFTSDTMFLNQLIEISTDLSPITLLKTIKKIEKRMGRTYFEPLEGEQYVSRIIDIDILKIQDLNYRSECLCIPHCQNFKRKFVKNLVNMF